MKIKYFFKQNNVADEFKESVCEGEGDGDGINIKFSLGDPVHFSSLLGPHKMFLES